MPHPSPLDADGLASVRSVGGRWCGRTTASVHRLAGDERTRLRAFDVRAFGIIATKTTYARRPRLQRCGRLIFVAKEFD